MSRFLEVFRLAARQAGAVARRLQGEVGNRGKEGSETPEEAALSLADLAAQDVLLLALAQAFPGVAVDAEEETATTGLFPPEDEDRPLVVVDPVDGSLAYLGGSHDWAVMGAWVEGGRYRAGVVAFPGWQGGELLWAREGRGAWRQTGRGEARPAGVVASEKAPVLVSPWLGEAGMAVLRRLGGAVEVCRCSAVDGTAPVTGRGRASVAPGALDRRRAVAAFVAATAGAEVWLGERRWAGEDPETLPRDLRPTVTARTEGEARRLLEALATG